MFAANKLVSLTDEECINSLKEVFSHFLINREILKLFWEFKENEYPELTKQLFSEALPSFNVLLHIAKQCKISVLKLLNKIDINASLEIILLSIGFEGVNPVDIDLTPLKECKQLQRLYLRGKKLEKIDISHLVQNSHLYEFIYNKETTHLICDEKLIDKIQSPALLEIKEIIEPIRK